MKRYNPWGKIWGKSKLREDEKGDYLQYEEVRDLIENILNDCSLWETKPETLIKEWGESPSLV